MISRLRRVLGNAIESHPAGYRLALGCGHVDSLAFEELAGQGSRALADGDPARASAVLGQALALGRGPALAGLPAAGPVGGIAAPPGGPRRSPAARPNPAGPATAAPAAPPAATPPRPALVAAA